MIFYLSCTGNTRWASECLAEVTNDKMVSIFDAVQSDCVFPLKRGERVGFCFPVHGWYLQDIISNFLDKLCFRINDKIVSLTDGSDMLSGVYAYCLLTAGDSIGEVMKQFEKRLGKSLKLSAKCALVMPESYIGLPFMDVDTDLREAEKKFESSSELRKFAEAVLHGRAYSPDLPLGYAPRVYTRIIGPFFRRFLITDKRFHVDTEKCVGCGKCVKVCPVNNISLIEKTHTPQWLHTGQCLTCFACYHYCEKHAIDFWVFTKNKGQYYYSHNKKNSKLQN